MKKWVEENKQSDSSISGVNESPVDFFVSVSDLEKLLESHVLVPREPTLSDEIIDELRLRTSISENEAAIPYYSGDIWEAYETEIKFRFLRNAPNIEAAKSLLVRDASIYFKAMLEGNE
jgi:hypothetical protein